MSKSSYAYSVGNVRAKENGLLSNNDIEHILLLSDEKEIAELLRDKGMGDSGSNDSLESILHAENSQLWDYIRETSPDFSVFLPFILVNDFHNLKTIIKGILSGREYAKNIIKNPISIDVKTIKTAVGEKRFELLPAAMAKVGLEAYEILASSSDPQLADAVLDVACMTEQLKSAVDTRTSIIIQYFSTLIFYNCIKIALRCAIIGKRAEFLQRALPLNTLFDKKELILAAVEGEKAVIELVSKYDVFFGGAAMDAYNISPSEFEKFIDNRLMCIAKVGKYKTLGPEPLFGYLIARLCEQKMIRIIASGFSANKSEIEIREKLRELYG